ncbi:protein of unknown function [Burkholderia multivorans]
MDDVTNGLLVHGTSIGCIFDFFNPAHNRLRKNGPKFRAVFETE